MAEVKPVHTQKPDIQITLKWDEAKQLAHEIMSSAAHFTVARVVREGLLDIVEGA